MRSSRIQRQVVVRTHRPWLRQFLVVVVLGLFVVQGWVLYDFGKIQGNSELADLRKVNKQQKLQLQSLGEQNAECSQTVANLEQNKEIDQLAYAEVERNLQDFHTEMADLKEELEFYRAIVAPSSSERGLKIYRLKMAKTPEDRKFRYKLVLIQVMTNKRVTGSVDLKMEGRTPQGAKTLNLVQLGRKKRLGFKFVYYQVLEGDLEVPDGFTPNRVTVTVRPSGNENASKTFEWQEVLG